MIYKPSNPFSVVIFLITLLVQGLFLAADWIAIRYSFLFSKSKSRKAELQTWP